MDTSSGQGSMGAPYEYVIKPKKTAWLIAQRVCLIVFYVLWVAANVAVIILLKKYIALMIAFCSITLWLFYVLTWRRTFVEYEYVIYGGELKVYRIIGNRSRRRLASVDIRSIDAIIPYDDEHLHAIQAFGAKKKAYAVSGLDAPLLYVLLWKDERDVKRLLCMEPTEKAIKLLRYQNISAFRA